MEQKCLSALEISVILYEKQSPFFNFWHTSGEKQLNIGLLLVLSLLLFFVTFFSFFFHCYCPIEMMLKISAFDYKNFIHKLLFTLSNWTILFCSIRFCRKGKTQTHARTAYISSLATFAVFFQIILFRFFIVRAWVCVCHIIRSLLKSFIYKDIYIYYIHIQNTIQIANSQILQKDTN